MSDHRIEDDNELRVRIRSATFYENSPGELPQGDLQNIIRNAKLRLDNRADVTTFYGDSGIEQALLYTTMIEAKCAMENYSVTRWDVGSGEIDVDGAGDEEQAQFSQWATWVQSGLQASDAETADMATNIVSNSYVG